MTYKWHGLVQGEKLIGQIKAKGKIQNWNDEKLKVEEQKNINVVQNIATCHFGGMETIKLLAR